MTNKAEEIKDIFKEIDKKILNEIAIETLNRTNEVIDYLTKRNKENDK